MSEAKLGIGSTVWVFDHNRREYKAGRCVYGSHWVAETIEGETTKSWITKRGKIPKLPDERGRYQISQGKYTPLHIVLSAQDVDDDIWLHHHAIRVCDAVRSHNDPAILRQIAALVGYEPEERG